MNRTSRMNGIALSLPRIGLSALQWMLCTILIGPLLLLLVGIEVFVPRTRVVSAGAAEVRPAVDRIQHISSPAGARFR